MVVIAQKRYRGDSKHLTQMTDTRKGSRDMLRAALAVTASLVLVGILGLLINESRNVDEEYYAAHAERVRAIETTREDLAAITEL